MLKILSRPSPGMSTESNAMPCSDPAAELKILLNQVASNAGSDFSGIGVIVWDGETPLPVLPMQAQFLDQFRHCSTRELLSAISREDCSFHDGFHVLNRSLQLVQASVYFSPQIVAGIDLLGRARSYGGRYYAAAFGSCLNGVICTGVLSQRYGPFVLRNGQEL